MPLPVKQINNLGQDSASRVFIYQSFVVIRRFLKVEDHFSNTAEPPGHSRIAGCQLIQAARDNLPQLSSLNEYMVLGVNVLFERRAL
jgi:hypothetical protein